MTSRNPLGESSRAKPIPHIRALVWVAASLLFLPLLDRADEASGQAYHHAGDHLGKVDFPVSCSPQAQVVFNRAVALLHHMTYPQAREAFEHVLGVDPKCAMAEWGVAMTLFQPLWPTRPSPAALERGWEAVQKAKTLNPPTEREQLFVASTEAFYLDPKSPDWI